jgi:hypothetical protein
MRAGPWHVTGSAGLQIVDAGGHHVGLAAFPDEAQIMAAAPELRDLLRRLLALYEGQRLAPPETFASYWHDVRAVLARLEVTP